MNIIGFHAKFYSKSVILFQNLMESFLMTGKNLKKNIQNSKQNLECIQLEMYVPEFF
jgi:hypothetical protein